MSNNISDENAEYGEWVEANKEDVLEDYKESLDFSDVPDDFIRDYYNRYNE